MRKRVARHIAYSEPPRPFATTNAMKRVERSVNGASRERNGRQDTRQRVGRAVIPGRASARARNPFDDMLSGEMDSGLIASRCPGMTTLDVDAQSRRPTPAQACARKSVVVLRSLTCGRVDLLRRDIGARTDAHLPLPGQPAAAAQGVPHPHAAAAA